MTTWIAPYKRYSNGAKNLSDATGYRRLVTGRGVRRGDRIINWGSSEIPYDTRQCTVLNGTAAVRDAANKLRFFQKVGALCSTVPWTADKRIATEWGVGCDVVARTILTGHSGAGIVIVPQGGVMVDAPLYTKYVKKDSEYRIHVAFGQVIDSQRKIRDPDREPTDWKVRNHQNGFIFVRNGIQVPDGARTQSIAAVEACGLDFGAVDVIVKRDGTVMVLEVNTSPGLEGQTITSYAEAFRNGNNRAA